MNADELRRIVRQSEEAAHERARDENNKQLAALKSAAERVIQQLPTMLSDAARAGKRTITVFRVPKEYMIEHRHDVKVKDGWFSTRIETHYTWEKPDYAEAVASECRRLGCETDWRSTTMGDRNRYVTGEELVVRW